MAYGRNYRRGGAPTKANSVKNQVAELMAEGLETHDIADRLGSNRKAVNARIADIRRDLGWQAQ